MTEYSFGTTYIIMYSLLWGYTLYSYIKKFKGEWNVATFIISTYFVYSIFAIISYVFFPAFSYNTLTFFPLLYLFVMLLLGLVPITTYAEGKYESIYPPSQRLFLSLVYFYLLLMVLTIPSILLNIRDGLEILLTEEDGGNMLYKSTSSQYVRKDGQISNIFAIFYNFLSPTCSFLFFYYLTLKNRKKWVLISLGFSILVTVLDRLSHGQRTGPTMVALIFISTFFLMKPYLSEKLRHKMQRITIIVGIILLVPFITLTNSRFQNKGGAIKSVVYYIGEAPIYFDNYCMDAGGVRYGDRTAPEFKRLIGFTNVPKDEPSRRDKYPNLKIDAYWFYTYVGDFVLDYGPIMASVLFIVFSKFFTRLTRHRKRGAIPFHKLLLVYFAMTVCVQGGMYLFNYAHYGNYAMMTIVLLYLVFQYDYQSRVSTIKSSEASV